MDMQYEDKDGDMLALTAASDFSDLVAEAQVRVRLPQGSALVIYSKAHRHW